MQCTIKELTQVSRHDPDAKGLKTIITASRLSVVIRQCIIQQKMKSLLSLPKCYPWHPFSEFFQMKPVDLEKTDCWLCCTPRILPFDWHWSPHDPLLLCLLNGMWKYNTTQLREEIRGGLPRSERWQVNEASLRTFWLADLFSLYCSFRGRGWAAHLFHFSHQPPSGFSPNPTHQDYRQHSGTLTPLMHWLEDREIRGESQAKTHPGYCVFRKMWLWDTKLLL